MKVSIYRRKITKTYLVWYNIYINGINKAVITNGETISLDLPAGKNSIEIKGFPPPLLSNNPIPYYGLRINPPKSGKIILDIPQAKSDSSLYFVIGYSVRSMADALKRTSKWIFCALTSRQKPHKLLFEQVDKSTFKKIQNERQDEGLVKTVHTSKEKQLVLQYNIIGVLSVVFGLYLLTLQNGSEDLSRLGWVIFVAGTANAMQLVSYWRKSTLTYSYNVIRSVCILFVLLMVVFGKDIMGKQPMIAAICLLFVFAYGYIFFVAKRVLKRSGE